MNQLNVKDDQRIGERIRLCKVQRRAYEIWLKTLTPANFMLVGVGGVFALVAGLAIITEAQLVSAKAAGWLAVAGAVLTGLHAKLKCEPHQAECKKLANQFAELQTEYESLELVRDELAKNEQLIALEHKLAAIRAGRQALPSNRAIAIAEREIEGTPNKRMETDT